MKAFWTQLIFTVVIIPVLTWLAFNTAEAVKATPEVRQKLRTYAMGAFCASMVITFYFLLAAS